MKFTNQVAALSALSIASALPTVTLTVESAGNSTVDGHGLSPIHFGAGINGVMLSKSALSFNYDPATKQVFQEIALSIGSVSFTFSEFSNVLTAGVTGSPYALVQNGYLSINGSDSVFYACSQLAWDPYHYASPSNFGIGIYASDAPVSCVPIKIKAVIDPVTAAGNFTTSVIGALRNATFINFKAPALARTSHDGH